MYTIITGMSRHKQGTRTMTNVKSGNKQGAHTLTNILSKDKDGTLYTTTNISRAPNDARVARL